MELLLSTPTGSRLYGTAHDGSDYDTFEVYTGKKKMRQLIQGDQDRIRASYDQFFKGLSVGVPQYLEALWSPLHTVNRVPWLTAGFVPDYGATTSRYLRTIKSFWLSEQGALYKRRCHAVRLYLNLLDLLEHGKFCPVLTEKQIEFCEAYVLFERNYPRL